MINKTFIYRKLMGFMDSEIKNGMFETSKSFVNGKLCRVKREDVELIIKGNKITYIDSKTIESARFSRSEMNIIKKRISDNINEKEQELEHERLKEQDKNNYELQNMFNKLNAFDELYNDLLKRTNKLEYDMIDALIAAK